MRERNRAILAAAAALSILLGGCGSGGDAGDDLPGTPQTTIHHVALTGSNGVTSAGGSSPVPVISPTLNAGLFELEWDVTSSKPYHIDWYLSTDAILSNDDREFFSRNCDLDAPDASCPGSEAWYQCKFDSSSIITCAVGEATAETNNVTAYLASAYGLPAAYKVIVRACDGLFASCRTEWFSVLLQ